MRRIIPGLLALTWSAAACAATSLHFGPPQQWVKPTPVPAAGTATQAAVKILLVDHQIELTSRTVRYYVESAIRIQTPQGLSAMGTLTLAWNPDTDVVTVHKIHILRGHQVIDVLGAGQTFTIAKRETNLDYASLDNTLTAILQPADLQVGDTLDIAYTLERTDPILAGALAANDAVSPEMSINELHISALWPSTEPVKWQASEGLTGLRQIHDGGMSGVSLTMSDVQPILQPKYAPLRFLIDRRIDFSGLGSWSDVAKRLAPLYEYAARLSPHSPLQTQIARIKAATPDPKARAALALALVEDQVRYVFLAMNDGGLVPASADQTWARRYGDCKGKTVLLLALLHGLGIEARPVAVNIQAGDGLDARLPTIALFDHVLVEATIGGKDYWLDGTRLGDHSLDHLHVPYYHWGLPLVAAGAALVKMVPAPRTTPLTETTISIDASSGVARPVPFHVEVALHGYAAIAMKQRLANLSPAQLDAGLRSLWARQYDFVTVQSVAATYDEGKEVERLTMDGTAKLDWSGGEYAPTGLGVGYDADFQRQPGPHRDAPYAVAYPTYDRNALTIKLPLEGKGFSILGGDVERTLGGVEYRRQAKIDGGVFTAVETSRSVETEFPAAQAAADQQALRDLSKNYLNLVAPTGHKPTAAEIAWGVPRTASTALQFAKSGYVLSSHGEFAAADQDFHAALALDSRNAWVLADQAHLAIAVAPTGYQPYFVAGAIYMNLGEQAKAITAFNHGATLGMTVYSYLERAAVRPWTDLRDRRADIVSALKLNPNSPAALAMLAEIQLAAGQYSEAIASLTNAMGKRSGGAGILTLRGIAYAKAGQTTLADEDFANAVKAAKLPAELNNMCWQLATQQVSLNSALDDCNAAVAREPRNAAFLDSRGFVRLRLAQYDKAISDYDAALRINPLQPTALYGRGICELREGKTRRGQADIRAGTALSYAVADQFAHYGVRP